MTILHAIKNCQFTPNSVEIMDLAHNNSGLLITLPNFQATTYRLFKSRMEGFPEFYLISDDTTPDPSPSPPTPDPRPLTPDPPSPLCGSDSKINQFCPLFSSALHFSTSLVCPPLRASSFTIVVDYRSSRAKLL